MYLGRFPKLQCDAFVVAQLVYPFSQRVIDIYWVDQSDYHDVADLREPLNSRREVSNALCVRTFVYDSTANMATPIVKDVSVKKDFSGDGKPF
jgi:hypothetical protein